MLGSLLAVGRTSRVYGYGNDAVVKVLDPEVPQQWAAVEAHLTEAVRTLGVPAPAVLDVTTIDGHAVIIFERVGGITMWEQMQADHAGVPTLVADLAAVQRMIHAAGVPDGVAPVVDRMASKIATVETLSQAERAEASELVDATPRGGALLHGDLHPGNVLLGGNGPVVIDWFDAAVGHPIADVVRTSLLLRAEGGTDLRHLPGATPELVTLLHTAYLDEMHDVIDAGSDAWRRWKAITAVSRLAERTESDPAGLLAIWADRPAIA